MRILHINKFAYPKGGAEYYMLRTATRQSELGHDVAVLGSDPDSSSLPAGVRTYGLEVPDFHSLSGVDKLRAAVNVLWSKEAADVVDAAMQDFRPDVVHLHNYAHQLSSSILAVIRKRNVPSIYTAHDYKLICPAYVANVDNHDCFACSSGISTKLIRKKCHHGSLQWSTVVSAEALIVRGRNLLPDKIIGPSRFMTNALRESWLGRKAVIELLRNPVTQSGLTWTGGGGYLLYVGRLSREKGIDKLITAAAELQLPLKIAGDGPLRSELELHAASVAAEVAFVGHVEHEDLTKLREECLAQVLSSTWPENAPLSALEAAADGVPLIVTDRGGLPEFADMGARIAIIQQIDSREVKVALESLGGYEGDLDEFARLTSWDLHLQELERIYSEPLEV